MAARFKDRTIVGTYGSKAHVFFEDELAILFNHKNEVYASANQNDPNPENDNDLTFYLYGCDPDDVKKLLTFTDPDSSDGIETATQQVMTSMFGLNFDPEIGIVTVNADKYMSEDNINLFVKAIQNGADLVCGKPLEKPILISIERRNTPI